MLYVQGISLQNFPIRKISKLLINFERCHPVGNYMFKVDKN